MRVGWVEITPGPDGPIFRATSSGVPRLTHQRGRAVPLLIDAIPPTIPSSLPS
jgi:hypothetical protein